jgi:hypothetical protein
MYACELFKQDGTPTNIWMCGQCGRGWNGNKDVAERCCRCDHCGGPLDEKKDYGKLHRECARLRGKQLYNSRIEKAVKLDAWDGPVFNDHDGDGDERDYYNSIDDMKLEFYDDKDELPEYVFVCDSVPAVQLCIIDILEEFVDLDEDRNCAITGEPELEEALDAFNKANVGIVIWKVDYSRVVRVENDDVA